jgi:pilus assembly protein CpaE
MNNKPRVDQGGDHVISILLVDDSVDTRENIKKLLLFESDFKVVGVAGTGREAVEQAKQLRPDIIIMDINMPDMDGIQATSEITKVVPTTAVIMMSVQNDQDYLRKAMLAGARNFLIKPIDPDELYNTVRTVYQRNKPLAKQYEDLMAGGALIAKAPQIGGGSDGDEQRAGHVIVVYSPQGGAGTTTVATNLASGLMKKGIKVLLIDTDLQFGDVGVFLKLQSQSTLLDLVSKVEDLDIEFFDTVIATHESGLKVLMGPPRPEFAEEVEANPTAVARMIEKVASNYDFIVVDTGKHLNEMVLSLMDMAAKIVLVATPTLAAVKNVRFMLELFDKLNYQQNKTVFVLNRTEDERARQRVTIPTEAIEKHLKIKVQAKIPTNEQVILSAVNRGVPVIASQRDRNRSPIKEMVDLADMLYNALTTTEQPEPQLDADKNKKRPGLGLGLRRV